MPVKVTSKHREEVYKRLCIGTSLDAAAPQFDFDDWLPDDEDNKANISNRNDEGLKRSVQFDNDSSVVVCEKNWKYL